MKLYKGKVEPASREIVEQLIKENLIEVLPENKEEVVKDIMSVLNEYIRVEREITEKAKDIIAQRDLDYSYLSRIKRQLAAEKKVGIDEDAIDYIVRQIIEILLCSTWVEEVWGMDHEINRVVAPILRKHMAAEEEIEKLVQEQIKHLKEAEGTMIYEIEYRRIKNELERLKKLK